MEAVDLYAITPTSFMRKQLEGSGCSVRPSEDAGSRQEVSLRALPSYRRLVLPHLVLPCPDPRARTTITMATLVIVTAITNMWKAPLWPTNHIRVLNKGSEEHASLISGQRWKLEKVGGFWKMTRGLMELRLELGPLL